MELDRFITAQQHSYPTALSEIKVGKKTSHWMWFIFPQIQGLGRSDMARRYGISSVKEAQSYLDHPILGTRLREISSALLELASRDPAAVLGSPDDLKLRSCMTLFASLPNSDPVFQKVLDKFFHGQKDPRTIDLLNAPIDKA